MSYSSDVVAVEYVALVVERDNIFASDDYHSDPIVSLDQSIGGERREITTLGPRSEA